MTAQSWGPWRCEKSQLWNAADPESRSKAGLGEPIDSCAKLQPACMCTVVQKSVQIYSWGCGFVQL